MVNRVEDDYIYILRRNIKYARVKVEKMEMVVDFNSWTW